MCLAHLLRDEASCCCGVETTWKAALAVTLWSEGEPLPGGLLCVVLRSDSLRGGPEEEEGRRSWFPHSVPSAAPSI